MQFKFFHMLFHVLYIHNANKNQIILTNTYKIHRNSSFTLTKFVYFNNDDWWIVFTRACYLLIHIFVINEINSYICIFLSLNFIHIIKDTTQHIHTYVYIHTYVFKMNRVDEGYKHVQFRKSIFNHSVHKWTWVRYY